MILSDPKGPLLFGLLMIGLLGVYLGVFHSMPGSLASPHAEVIQGTGLGTCKACHAEQGLTAGCLECHVEIAGQLETDQGFHAFLARAGCDECAACHPEHLGAHSPLVSALSWEDCDFERFAHLHVEFTLTGAHDGLACHTCHEDHLARPFTLSAFSTHPRKSTYLGLIQECVDCHEDVHAGGLANDCEGCHDQQAWRPAARFRHQDYYVLEGAHTQAKCSGCHLIPDRDDPNVVVPGVSHDIKLAFNRVRGKTCVECHEDPHRMSWGQECTACHLGTDDAWTEGRRGISPEVHAMTGFTLEPPHAEVACEKCHRADLAYRLRYPDPNALDYRRRNDTCEGCHDDPHAGQFRETYPQCLDCHEKGAFSPARFDILRHADRYPLSEPHVAAECNGCHTVAEATGVRRYVATPRECGVCHEDPHAGQFNNRYASCLDCHIEDRFQPTQFNLDRHAKVYSLKGGHKGIPCVRCHIARGEDAVRQFVTTPRQCRACHENPHGSQFQVELQDADCTICHSDEGETFQIRPYDHYERTGYRLTGAHAQAACAECHPEQRPGDPKDAQAPIRVFRPTATACASCHKDIHRGQFQEEGAVRCDRCHGSTTSWEADRFDHDRDSRFALEGSHEHVRCEACHPAVRQPDGEQVVQYRPLETRCEDCHGFVPK